MVSISLLMLSNSWIAEKSVLNPFIALSVGVRLLVGVVHALEILPLPFTDNRDVVCPQMSVVMATEVMELRGAGNNDVVGVVVSEGGGGALTLPRSDGGIIAAVSSCGMSFFRTFSAMRYIARANCSELRRPFFSMSHKFLQARRQTNE